ncbi:TPA: hypothetical protein N0F65_006334 [Lagenidium giganteum]|uniref:E3 ubiquitin-protein ligase CHIP n=1 Tax=Lagenidium giganteum TaxID=4803 RepID=A0AAV2YL74_9STRA|nr:TPA: hypothetical protein N0F65_006334 [Lagenidium giganteum]
MTLAALERANDLAVRLVRRLLQEAQLDAAKDAFLKLPDVEHHAAAFLDLVLRAFYAAGYVDVAVVLSFLESLPNWNWTRDGCCVLHDVDRVLRTPTATTTLQVPTLALAYFLHGLVGRLDGGLRVRAESYWYEWISPTLRAIVTGRALVLVASQRQETMYAPSSDFAFDSERRHVFCWRKAWEPDDNKEKWRLIPANKQKDRFFLQHVLYEEYVYAADYAKFRRDDQGNFRSRVFTWRHRHELPGDSGHWQLVPLDADDREVFALYNPYQKEFLHAAADCYDKDRRYVLTTAHRPQDKAWLEERQWRLIPAEESALERGIEAFFTKQYVVAVEQLTAALEQLPDHTEHVKCYAYRMTANLRLRNFDAITADYREVQRLGGDKAAIFHGLAHLWEENTAFLEEIQGPFFVQHQLSRGDDCFVRKEYEVAAFFFQEAASTVLPEEETTTNGEKDVSKSVQLRRARAWLGCAKCFYALAQVEVATTHLENILSLSGLPADLEAQALLWQGKCCRKQEQYDEALRHLERAFDVASTISTTSSLAQSIMLEMRFIGVLQKNLLKELLAPPSSRGISQDDATHTSEQSMEQLMEMFHCPLSLELMVDPVMTPNGDTYEREMIEKHLSINGHFDPLTRAPLTKDMLYPNRALKTLMQAMLNEHRLGILLASCSS